jgi:hypothetical protein
MTTRCKQPLLLTGNAPRDQSERIFSESAMICPAVHLNDIRGRPAIVNTLYTKNAGCNSALDRQCVENKLRSSEFSSIQLSSLGVETGGNTDTVRAIRSFIALEHAITPRVNIPDRMAVYNQTLRNVQGEQLAQKVQYFKGLSGMD